MGRGNGGALIHFRFSSEPELLCVVRQAMESLAAMLGMSPSECRSVTLAVDEALTNIIRHAYGNRRDGPIEISCRRLHGRAPGNHRTALEVLLIDHGCGADPARLRRRTRREPLPCGGLGLQLIRASMDEVEYRRRRGSNQLRLVKYLKRRPAGKTA